MIMVGLDVGTAAKTQTISSTGFTSYISATTHLKL
jgi:hypothetical protein